MNKALRSQLKTQSEANVLIDAGQPLGAIIPLFGSRLDAASHFAKRQAVIRAADRATGACCCCNATNNLRLVRFDWKAYLTPSTYLSDLAIAIAKANWGVYRPLPTTDRVTFSTYDSLCEACAASMRTRKLLALAAEFLSTFVLFLSMLATPFVLLTYFWLLSRSDRPALLPYVWLTLFSLLAGILSSFAVDALRNPKALRHIGCRPFRLQAVKPVL